MYAGGTQHPLRDPCQAVLRRVAAGTLDATTSAEVAQEIFHRFVAIRRPSIGVSMARGVLDAFDPVLPITHRVVSRVPDLVQRYPALAARDLIHVATCLEEELDAIISPDTGFDHVSEIKRIDPMIMSD